MVFRNLGDSTGYLLTMRLVDQGVVTSLLATSVSAPSPSNNWLGCCPVIEKNVSAVVLQNGAESRRVNALLATVEQRHFIGERDVLIMALSEFAFGFVERQLDFYELCWRE